MSGYQVLEENQFTLGQKLTVTVDFTSGTWNTVGTHELFDISGLVMFRLVASVSETLTSGGSATLDLGNDVDNSAYIASTSYNSLGAGKFWFNAGGAAHGTIEQVVIEGCSYASDIGYKIGTAALTDGTMTFTLYYTLLDAPAGTTSSVSAGAGGSL